MGWSGSRNVSLQGLNQLPFCLFSAPSTILKPLTMPNIQITEVDVPDENDQMSSPTGTRVVGGAPQVHVWWEELHRYTYGGRSIWFGANSED